MERELLKQRLVLAEKHIVEGIAHVERQRQMVEGLANMVGGSLWLAITLMGSDIKRIEQEIADQEQLYKPKEFP